MNGQRRCDVYLYGRISLSHKKKEISPLATTWVDLEGVMFSEVNQTERQILWDLACMWNLKEVKLTGTVERWLPGAGGSEWEWGDVGQSA